MTYRSQSWASCLLVLAILCFSGCAVEGQPCQTDDDCASDQVCSTTGGVLVANRICIALVAEDSGATTDAADSKRIDADATDDQCADGGSPVELFRDEDGDGWGAGPPVRSICPSASIPTGLTDKSGDCDDMSAEKSPGVDEVCNGEDDNCNGKIDEGLATETWYRDTDGDGFAASDAEARESCMDPSDSNADWVQQRNDCEPTEPDANPMGTEACDGLDNDCNGDIDEGCDDDGDGWCDERLDVATPPPDVCKNGGGDCDDAADGINPGAAEVCDDRADNNCNGAIDERCACNYMDRTVGVCSNGRRTQEGTCEPPATWESTETSSSCDGLDNDCDGSTDEPC